MERIQEAEFHLQLNQFWRNLHLNSFTKTLTILTILTKTKLEDKIKTSVLLEKLNMLSINQINAQIKIQEIWKALNIVNYPLKVDRKAVNVEGISTRACTSGRLIESGKSCISQKTCINDAIRIWNQLPIEVTSSKTLSHLKMQTKKFVKTLPI